MLKDYKKKLNKIRKHLKSLSAMIVVFFIVFLVMSCSLIYILERNINNDQYKSWFDSIWWFFVTVTTTGYGDKFPLSFWGKIVGIITMLIGVIFVGTVSGQIASFLVNKTMQESRGMIDTKDLTGHIILCGWKNNMSELLADILIYNKSIVADDLLIITPSGQDVVETFRQNYQEFREVKIMRGEYYNEHILKSSNVNLAKRIFILADESTPASQAEIDSRTVITAMTVRKLSKDVYICAELLDLRFEPYLKSCKVDEIIYIHEYSKILLANATSHSGIIKVLSSLLDIRSENSILSLDFPSEFDGKKYSELKTYYADSQDKVIIGLLENVGGFSQRKRDALKEAQKTPNIVTLVENLKKVKKLETHVPVINPPFDYIVKPNSLAIFIGKHI